MKGFLASASSRPQLPPVSLNTEKGTDPSLPLGSPCSSVLRGPVHWSLCFALSLVTGPYIAARAGVQIQRGKYHIIIRDQTDLLCKLGSEPQNHKGLRFVANSKSCVQPWMVSHELGFISPWSRHIPGDPPARPLDGRTGNIPKCIHLISSSMTGTALSRWPGQAGCAPTGLSIRLKACSVPNSLHDFEPDTSLLCPSCYFHLLNGYGTHLTGLI